jgi:hypothetical protein
MTLVQFGRAAQFIDGAVGTVAGALIMFYPSHAVPLGATVAVCAVLGTYLGAHLPSMSPIVNANAVAAATATGASVTIEGKK